MEFVTVSPNDTPRVLEFYERAIDLFPADGDRPGWKKGIYPIKEDLLPHALEGNLFGLIDNGEFVGGMVLNCQSEDAYDLIDWGIDASHGEYLVVHTLGILPTHQKQGLGRRMMAEAARIGRERRLKAIRLDVLWSNYAAQHFYEKCGFIRRGQVDMYYKDTGLATFPLYEYIL